jgi:hypothetical protein
MEIHIKVRFGEATQSSDSAAPLAYDNLCQDTEIKENCTMFDVQRWLLCMKRATIEERF